MQWIFQIDRAVLAGMQAIRCAFLDAVMPAVTALGDAGAVWLVCAAVLLCTRRYRRAGVRMLAALALNALLCNLLLKPLIMRPRPYTDDPTLSLVIRPPKDFSFPSGHASAAAAAALSLLLGDRRIGIPAAILAALIAFSRLYLCVHYCSDVAAGVLLGCACALAVFGLDRLWSRRVRGGSL